MEVDQLLVLDDNPRGAPAAGHSSRRRSGLLVLLLYSTVIEALWIGAGILGKLLAGKAGLGDAGSMLLAGIVPALLLIFMTALAQQRLGQLSLSDSLRFLEGGNQLGAALRGDSTSPTF